MDAEHYRHIMRYYFHEGLNAAKTVHWICEVYGPDALKRTCDPEMAHFRVKNFSVKDAERGRPLMVDTGNQKSTQSASDDQRNLGNSWYVARKRCGVLRDAGYLSRMDVSYELSDMNLQQRLDACGLLLEKNKEHNF